MVAKKIATPAEAAHVRRLIEQGKRPSAIARETGLGRRLVAKIVDAETTKAANATEFEPARETMTRTEAVKTIHTLATRPQGVKNSELSPVLGALFGYRSNKDTGARELDMTKGQMDHLKKTVRTEGDGLHPPMFVPDWLPRQAPIEAWVDLLQLASELQDRITDMVIDYCARHPEVTHRQVHRELVQIAIPEAGKEPVEVRCARYLQAAEALHERLEQGPEATADRRQHLSQDRSSGAVTVDADLDALCI